jgi:hypothetical protein
VLTVRARVCEEYNLESSLQASDARVLVATDQGLPGERRQEVSKDRLIARDPLRVGRVVLVHAIALVILGEKGLGRRLLGDSKEARRVNKLYPSVVD